MILAVAFFLFGILVCGQSAIDEQSAWMRFWAVTGVVLSSMSFAWSLEAYFKGSCKEGEES
jgi:hypothetical protein